MATVGMEQGHEFCQVRSYEIGERQAIGRELFFPLRRE